MAFLPDYNPGPISIIDIVDGSIRTHGAQWYDNDPVRVSNTADELADMCGRIIASPQEILDLEVVCPKKELNKAKLRAYILARISAHVTPPTTETESVEQPKRIFTARVELVYQQYASVKIHITAPDYVGSRTVYIDDLNSVVKVLGHEPIKGTIIKVTNVRREQSTTTKGPRGKRTWGNQIIADICTEQN